MTARLIGDDPVGPPRLVRHINAACIWELPDWSAAPTDPAAQLQALTDMGVEAIQHPFPQMLPDSPLVIAGMGRVDKPEDANTVARAHKEAGIPVTTLHVGHGLETDAEIDRLIGAVLEASDRHGHPLFVETHRATVTQDLRRTLDLVERFPEIRFNADMSQWYTGHEMTYGDIGARFDALAPVFERARYMHGRIGTVGTAQMPLEGAGDDRPFVEHFREMWRRCMSGFLKTAGPGEILPFAPELMPYSLHVGGQEVFVYYARLVDGPHGPTEESDRWVQAQYLWDIARDCAQSVGLSVKEN